MTCDVSLEGRIAVVLGRSTVVQIKPGGGSFFSFLLDIWNTGQKCSAIPQIWQRLPAFSNGVCKITGHPSPGCLVNWVWAVFMGFQYNLASASPPGRSTGMGANGSQPSWFCHCAHLKLEALLNVLFSGKRYTHLAWEWQVYREGWGKLAWCPRTRSQNCPHLTVLWCLLCSAHWSPAVGSTLLLPPSSWASHYRRQLRWCFCVAPCTEHLGWRPKT